MSNDRPERCDLCRWWYRPEGECRRFPPPDIHAVGRWPESGPGDWCGEFRPAGAAPAAPDVAAQG